MEYDAEEFAEKEKEARARQQQQQHDWARFDKRKVVKEWLREQEEKGVVPVIKPKEHRCNRRLEDVVAGVWASPMNVSQPLKNFWRCVRSQEGFVTRRLCSGPTQRRRFVGRNRPSRSATWRRRRNLFRIEKTTMILVTKEKSSLRIAPDITKLALAVESFQRVPSS